MSGPLRRTKRSRPAESGEPLPEGQAAETESATPEAETPPVTPEPTRVEPERAPGATGTEPPDGGTTPAIEDTTPQTETPDTGAAPGTPASAPRRFRWRPFRRTPETAPPATAPPPVLLADPGTPAGVDPVGAPLRPPAGRRGRLRRRLRYLRRARELMLRDLGGLLYEVHRTGGGSVEAHATLVGAKVERIAGLDAEAHALEAALAAPRGETVVFEPGVGGTCPGCGELYGSEARFCANCGAALGAAPPTGAHAAVATREVPAERDRRAFWRRAARRARPASTPDERPEETPPGEPATPADDTAVVAPGDAPTAIVRPDEPKAADDPGAPPSDPGNPGNPTAPKDDPIDGVGNGRPEGHADPELSSGDPLVSEESRK